ncbi:autophagy protein 13 [Coemansia brasiliensis]|uniref:Autophagy-related protein 13 n=1 Tax=Coemansia brasiliensis TaxID=2650707 RepID=A0A9W8I9B8_9FUNG|nr:autophagy protein 13 [Coemansia brasiliensis]
MTQRASQWGRLSEPDERDAASSLSPPASISGGRPAIPGNIRRVDSARPQQARDARSEQVVHNFYTKAAQVIGHLRGAAGEGGSGARVDRWFGLMLADDCGLRDAARAAGRAQRALVVDVEVEARGIRTVVETWVVETDPAARAADLPRVYKQAIVLFRSLYAFASLLPAGAAARQIAAGSSGARMRCIVRNEHEPPALPAQRDIDTHAFAPVPTPLGALSVRVRWRCDWRLTEDLLPTLRGRTVSGDSASLPARVPVGPSSALHRSMMRRRLGGSLSPEPRSASSGSSGSVARSLGVAPFKSPSLSESPADITHRRSLIGEAAQAMPRLSESPSSVGSHSRRLSSSFGNRRTSLRRIGMSTRRHTLADTAQDIDAFIHMLDTRQPLSTYSQSRTQPTDSLRRFRGALNDFDGMSRDMADSVYVRAEPASMPDAAEMPASPFRRYPIPNPLRASSASTAAVGPSIDLLQHAFDGLSLDPPLSESTLLEPSRRPTNTGAQVPALAGSDRSSVVPAHSQGPEHPSPAVAIPRPSDTSAPRRSSDTRALSYRSPDTRPFSYRSDVATNTSRLGALLGATDENMAAGAAKGPRSTPSTPIQTPRLLVAPRNAPAADQLRSNFPPLSFIVPRARIAEHSPTPTPPPQPPQQQQQPQQQNDSEDDLMFQMESSTH